jgi:glycosyltransferase involved in cell wall biosynthesis
VRVLYIHQYFSTPKGASGNRSYMMARCLVSAGHKVTVVCGQAEKADTGLYSPFVRGRREGIVDGIYVIELELPYANRDGFLRRAVTFLRFAQRSTMIALQRDVDLVFATSTPLTAGIPGILSRWLRGRRFIFEVRDLWPELPRAMGVIKNPLLLWAMEILEWICYHSANRLIGLAPGIAEGIAKRGVKRENIMIIPNGCDLGLFDDSTALWRPDGVREGDLLAIFTGTHGIANGLDAILNAAAVLKDRGRNDIKLVLIGDGKLKPELKSTALALSLNNVIFCDPVPKIKLAGLMAGADVGMQILANIPAFYFGTSPNKFFDYLAAGLPVLNNYPGWLADLIKEHGCGYAIDPDDPIAFAEALIRAAENPEERNIMGANARTLAVKRFDRDVLADGFIDWLVRE